MFKLDYLPFVVELLEFLKNIFWILDPYLSFIFKFMKESNDAKVCKEKLYIYRCIDII